MDIQAVIYSRLASDPFVTSTLAEFNGGPAVFATATPEDIALGEQPILIIDAASSDTSPDTASEDYRQSSSILRLYSKTSGSESLLIAAAEAVRKSLKDWAPGAVNGGVFVGASVNGPTPAPTDGPDERGRLIILDTLIKET